MGAAKDASGLPNARASLEALAPRPLLQTTPADTTTTTLAGVTFGDGACGNSVEPAAIPAKGSTLQKIRLTFCVTVSVDSTKTFTYDATKWGIWLGTDEQNFYTGADRITVVADDNGLGGSDATRNARLTLELSLPDNKLPEAIYSKLDSSTGRERLAVTPFYSSAGKSPSDADTSRKGLRPAFMQNDVGAIAGAPSVKKITTSDGEFVVEVAPPANLASVDPRDANVKGNSSVSGYLIMYWNHDECQASKSWRFRANPAFDKAAAKNAAVSAKEFTCEYPGPPQNGAKGACPLGCSASKDTNLFDRSEEQVAVPRTVPGRAGESTTDGCYTVARIDASRSSYGVSGVENGSNFGVAVWALDSAGRPSLGRSACASLTPRDIPLASKEKGADISRSDCFVVTAAAGNTGSAAVHAWRVARDAYIERTSVGRAFTAWYYARGPGFAQWLDAHPALKPHLARAFHWSGRAFLSVARVGSDAWGFLARAGAWIARTAQEMLAPVAFAQGNTDAGASTTSTNSTSSATGGVEASSQSSSSTASDGSTTGVAFRGPSGALYLLVGVLAPSDDKKLYDAYYPNKKPLTLTLGQTFRLIDAAGEFGVGGEVSYAGATGRVPVATVKSGASVPEDVRGRRISFYSIGLAVATDYRFRIGQAPWLAPRVAVFGGAHRMREEVANSQDPNSSGASQEKTSGSLGAEGWGGVVGARGSLEFSALRLWGSEAGSMRFSYGLEDLAITLFASHSKDFSKKMLRVSGTQFGGGFVFLFL
jgi:hypothetical protein